MNNFTQNARTQVSLSIEIAKRGPVSRENLAADPVHDRPPSIKSGPDTDRLLAILDNLPDATDGQERGHG